MSVCPNPSCGRKIPQGETFCPDCGWGLIAGSSQAGAYVASEIACPKCGQLNPPDSRFCEMCGTEIVTAPPARAGVLCFPDNSEAEIHSGTQIFGRVELARFVPSQTEASWISRKHFSITSDGNDFYILDDASLNKTTLNGEEITGKGRMLLHDGDQIAVAGVVMIRFAIR